MAGIQQSPRQTYRGNCHCGAFVYEIDVPEITSVDECNCSICCKKGYLWVFLEERDFRVVSGDVNQLTGYTFGRGAVEHKFCPNCGTGIMRKTLMQGDEFSPGMELGINARAIQDINTSDLERKTLDGRSRGSEYDPPAHKGELPEAEAGKLYTGSCHCGRVTLAVKCSPITETFGESPIVICDCSVCERVCCFSPAIHSRSAQRLISPYGGYIWIYPNNNQVVLSGNAADIAGYLFGHRFVAKIFCRTCGVHLTNRFNVDIFKHPELAKGRPEELDDPPDDDKKKWQYRGRKKHPVNLRVLEGVDLSKLEFRRIEVKDFPPLYVNP